MTHLDNQTQGGGCPLLDLLTGDIVAEIFSFSGPVAMAKCSLSCKTLRQISDRSRILWRNFVYRSFSLASPNVSADWKTIYAYLAEKSKQRAQLLAARVIFSDDGSPVPGYPPENAVKIVTGAWCTNAGVEENVDLVLGLSEPSLISGFAARNGGHSFSAPLKEALAFCSSEPINLDAARAYDGQKGSDWVTRLEGSEPNEVWTGQGVSLDDLHRYSEASNRTSLDPPVLDHSYHQPLQPHTRPKVAFRFPILPRAYWSCLERRCQPTVARYVHFKLLNSYKTPHMLSDNIDVMDLHTFGIPLPELLHLLRESSTAAQPPPDPSYKRMHDIRDYPY